MTPPISARVQGIKISATKLMPMLAAASGRHCVSLGQGVPSFANPPHVVDALCARLRAEPGTGKYSLQPGDPALRRACAGLLAREKGLDSNPDTEIAITVGAMEALLMAMLTLVDKGDEVVVPAPCYPSHVEQVLLAEGKPVFAPLKPDWSLDRDALAQAFSPRTRALILCNPSNPTGGVYSDDDVRYAAELCVKHDVTLITDETYDALVYGRLKPLSPATLPDMRDRVVAVYSFSKRFTLTGWRVGFCFAAAPLLDQMLKVHDCTAICAPTPAQAAALAALEGPQDYFENVVAALSRRRDLACSRLDALAPHFTYVRPEGAFYIMAKYRFTDAPSQQVAERLIREAGVITIPGGAFGPGGEGHLRLSFGGDEAEITECFDRIEAWLKQL